MKKFGLLFVLCLVASFAIAGPPNSDSVTNVSVKILPARDMSSAPNFVTNTVYVQGAYVTGDNKIYMALTAGTSGTRVPDHIDGDWTDGVTWRRVARGKRESFTIVNISSERIFLGFGYNAVTNKGIALNPDGGTLIIDNGEYQGDVRVISATGTNLVLSNEL